MSDQAELDLRESLRQKGVVIVEEYEDEGGEVTFHEVIGMVMRDGKEVRFAGRGDTPYNALRSLQVMLQAV